MIGSFDTLAAWIKQRDHIAVVTHAHPDGDALGSSLALCCALRALGKSAFAACADGVPENYRFLPGADALAGRDTAPFVPAYVLIADAGDPGRIGSLADWLEGAKGVAVLDHHATSKPWSEAYVIDPDAAATGMLVLRLIDALGAELTKDMATCLYVAISTDCGNFAFRNTKPETLTDAARCLAMGLDVDDLHFRLFRARRPARTKLLGKALSGIEFASEGRVALIRIPREMLLSCGATSEDADMIVNYGIDTIGVEVALLLEARGDAIKLSMRSRGKVDVGALAQKMGGGGHDCAAGATLEGTMEEAARYALSAIEACLE